MSGSDGRMIRMSDSDGWPGGVTRMNFSESDERLEQVTRMSE